MLFEDSDDMMQGGSVISGIEAKPSPGFSDDPVILLMTKKANLVYVTLFDIVSVSYFLQNKQSL